jgi:dipeptidyl aminopeptidase/acylaminoacyl peptidase
VRRLFAAVAACAFLAGGGPVPAAGLKPLTFEALRALITVREPQIAPDGTKVAYVRVTGDFKADRNNSELVLVDVGTGARRTLTHDRIGVHAPRWSPSGDRLAYLASPVRGKPAQLYVLPLNGGDSEKITDVKSGIDAYAWRPDGAVFAYIAEDAPPKAKTPEDYVPAFPVTDEHFLTRDPSRPAHAWTIGADGKGAKQITKGDATPSKARTELRWLPDGSAIVMTMQPDPVFAHFIRSRTTIVDVATGASRPVRPDSKPGAAEAANDGGFALASDGTRIALSVPRHGTAYLQHDLELWDLAGNRLLRARSLDRNPHWYDFGPDRSLFVGTSDGVRSVLWRLTPPADDTRAPAEMAATRVDLGDVDFAPDATIARNGTIAFVGQRRDDPNEIYVRPLNLGPANAAASSAAPVPRRLTNENAFLADYAVARRDRVDWTSDDGTKINGVLTYPTNYEPGKKYPLILDIHGGPVSTSTWDFGTIEGELCQVLAAHGFLVLQPNYRGSDNEGDAFLSAIVPHVTSGPGRDNLAGVEALKKMGIVDESRIGVSGWSGGGLQTAWLVGHASYWRAAVAGAGVYDWRQQAVLADINEQFAIDFLGGVSPWTKEGRAAFAAESPITYADAIRTPLLILSDTGDQRVPIAQSYALYHALRDRNRPVTFVAFPRAGHFPADPVGRETALRQWAGWFDRWMR